MPPENSGYMIAAYVVTAVILGGYAASLWVRARKVMGRRNGGTAGRRDGGTVVGQ